MSDLFSLFSASHTGDTGSILEQLTAVIKEHNLGFWDEVIKFVDAVPWREEKWLHGLLAFHLCLLVFVIFTRKNFTVQSVSFFTICLMVATAQVVNDFLSGHSQLFSTQNYFDSNGLFLSVVYSGPLLLLLIVILFNMIVMVASMLITVKRKQIAQEQRSKADKKRN